VPLESVTVWPVEIAVALMMMSAALVPTVRPVTITFPELSRNSALAAVPVAEAVAVNGVPDTVKTPLLTVPGVVPSVNDARTPVEPERADVPITSVPAVAVPVEDAIVLPATKSATNCIRFDLRAVEYVTAILSFL
jgi:hypothetical protein